LRSARQEDLGVLNSIRQRGGRCAARGRSGRRLLAPRTVSATIGLTGSIIAVATAIDARSIGDRLLGRGLPDSGIADRVRSRRGAVAALPGYVSTGSVSVTSSVKSSIFFSPEIASATPRARRVLFPIRVGRR